MTSPRDRLRDALTDLPAAYANLGRALVPLARLTRDTGSRQRHNDSVRAPVNLTAVDLGSTHHKIGASYVRDDYQLDKIAGRRMGILPTLAAWSRRADCELRDTGSTHPEHGIAACTATCTEAPIRAQDSDLHGPCSEDPLRHWTEPTVADECAFLLDHLDWIAAQNWLDEIADDVTTMLSEVLAVTGETEHEETYRCLKCGWRVEEKDGGAWYRCTGCPETYTRLELHRMAERKRPKTLPELAKLTGLAEVTLRKYESEGKITALPERRGNAKTYDLDHVMDATAGERYRPQRGANGRFRKSAHSAPSQTVI